MYKINEKQKEFIKIYMVFLILMFTIANWNSVSWAFSYKEVSGLAHDFFNPYPDSALLVSASDIHLPPRQTINLPSAPAPKAQYPYSDKENSLEIPRIGITSPLIIAQSANNIALEKDLDKGVVYYPGSVLPGEAGQIVVLGHSAPPNWPHIKHDWVFSDINNLNMNDQIILYFNNKQYIYLVKKKNIIQKGQELAFDGASHNMLTIVSCWPPGKDYQRIAVQAELQEM